MNHSAPWPSASVSAGRVRTPHSDTQAFPFGTCERLFAPSASALAAINRALVAVLQIVPPFLLLDLA
jgi:hypothetical protein